MKKDWEQSACLSYFSIAVIKHYAKVTYVFNFKLKYLIWLVVSEGLESMMAEQRNLRTHIYTAMRKRECALGSTVFWTLKACPNNDTAPPTRPHFFFPVLLKIDSLWISHHTPQSHLYLLSIPAASPMKRKQKIKTEREGWGKKQKQKTKAIKAAVCHGGTQGTLLSKQLYLHCSLRWLIILVQGLWLLLHHQHWFLTGTAPTVALCHGDPSALGLQDQPAF